MCYRRAPFVTARVNGGAGAKLSWRSFGKQLVRRRPLRASTCSRIQYIALFRWLHIYTVALPFFYNIFYIRAHKKMRRRAKVLVQANKQRKIPNLERQSVQSRRRSFQSVLITGCSFAWQRDSIKWTTWSSMLLIDWKCRFRFILLIGRLYWRDFRVLFSTDLKHSHFNYNNAFLGQIVKVNNAYSSLYCID